MSQLLVHEVEDTEVVVVVYMSQLLVHEVEDTMVDIVEDIALEDTDLEGTTFSLFVKFWEDSDSCQKYF
jgi:hypothetical protein